MALCSPLPDSPALAALRCCPGPNCSAWASALTKDRCLLMHSACGGFQSLKDGDWVFCKVRRKISGACVMVCQDRVVGVSKYLTRSLTHFANMGSSSSTGPATWLSAVGWVNAMCLAARRLPCSLGSMAEWISASFSPWWWNLFLMAHSILFRAYSVLGLVLGTGTVAVNKDPFPQGVPRLIAGDINNKHNEWLGTYVTEWRLFFQKRNSRAEHNDSPAVPEALSTDTAGSPFSSLMTPHPTNSWCRYCQGGPCSSRLLLPG